MKILMIVGDAGAPTSGEQDLHDELENSGHTADFITDTNVVASSGDTYDAAVHMPSATNGISSTVAAWTIGVVPYKQGLSLQYDLHSGSEASWSVADTDITITDDAHPIPTALGASNGGWTVMDSARAGYSIPDANMAPGGVAWCDDPSDGARIAGFTIAAGAALANAAGNAPGRRAFYGWHDRMTFLAQGLATARAVIEWAGGGVTSGASVTRKVVAVVG